MLFKRFMAALAKWASKIHVPFTRKRVTQEQIRKAMEVLKPGDLILTHVDGELTNLALSHWSHAGTFYNHVYEATTKGVVPTWLIYFLAHKDDFKILRPTFEFDVIGLGTFLQDNLGTPYDFEFESADKQFYCFELCAVSYMANSNVVINPVKTPAGYQYLAKSFFTEHFKEIHI